MTKKNKIMLIITSIITLLPVLIGVIFYKNLPEELATSFGTDGAATGYSGKAFAVFGHPAFLLFIHLLCVFMTMHDPKKKNISSKLFTLIMWICPLISVISSLAIYSHALSWGIDAIAILIIFLGILFTAIGNYLPKCKQNYTMGIKLPWTLADEDNWNKTHKLAGYIWTVGGILIILTAFLKIFWLLVAITVVMAVIPSVYSYVYYLKSKRRSK